MLHVITVLFVSVVWGRVIIDYLLLRNYYFPQILKAINAHMKSLKFVEVVFKKCLKYCTNNTQCYQLWQTTGAGNDVLDEPAFEVLFTTLKSY